MMTPTQITTNIAPKTHSPKLAQIAEQLSDHFDTRVSVQSGKAKGKITIEFSGGEDLDRIVEILKKKN